MAVTPQRLPIPPTPVMPPEGLAPVTQEVGLGAGDDAMSPTTMVLNYLKARGYTPSSENVRRALEANQRDPGVISGLRSDRPATDAEDQAAMAAARGGGGGGRTSAAPTPAPQGGSGPAASGPYERVDTGAPPLPNANATGGGSTYERVDGGGGSGAGALPAGPSIANSIINGLPLAAAGGAGAYALNRYMQNNQTPSPVVDLPATIPPAPSPIRGPGNGIVDYTQLAPPEVSGGDLGAALNKAVPPVARPVEPVPPARPGGSGGAQDVLDEAAIAAGRAPAPKVPFGSASPRVAPTAPLPVVRPGVGTVLRGILQHARP